MDKNKKNILNKLYVVTILLVIFFVVIIIKIFNIQYVEGSKYRELAEKTTIVNDTIVANKGSVYSSDGNLLATSVSKFTIHMDVKILKKSVFEKNIDSLAIRLSQLLEKPTKYYQDKLMDARKRGDRYLLIAKNINYNDYLKIKTFPILNLGVNNGGIIVKQKTVRIHPIGKIAERTIGYDDYRGEAGIEGAFAKYLKGENGWRLKQKIAKGKLKPINDANEKEPIEGKDVITTIDVNFQDITHHALLKQMIKFEAEHGCAVVMETATGEIKAIANLGITSKGEYYEKRNYAVWESQEPGSVFKLASLMAALEDKVVDTTTMVNCGNGKIFINNEKVEDSKAGGYGKISVARIFEVSSNVGIVKIIKKYYDKNPEKFISKIKKFGLDKKTGILIKGEGTPYIPNPKNKKWSPISLEWMAWGYGLSLTPLQILTFYNGVANNGDVVKPCFVKEIKKGNKVEKKFEKEVLHKKIASQETINKVKKVMENVVKKGTASNIYLSNFSMAGKTGTAKKWIPSHKNKQGKIVKGHYSDKHYMSSFVGFFPVENPKYSCIVVIHNSNKIKGYYGGVVAAPVFKEIAQKLYTTIPSNVKYVNDKVLYSKVESDYKEYDKKLQKYKTIMPNLLGMSGIDAISLLENMGVIVKFSGIGKVIEQSLERGKKVKKGTVVYLKLT